MIENLKMKSDLRKETKREKKRDLRKETIAVLVEEAESLLELRDLFVGELIGHWRRLKSEKIRRFNEKIKCSLRCYVENDSREIMLFI